MYYDCQIFLTPDTTPATENDYRKAAVGAFAVLRNLRKVGWATVLEVLGIHKRTLEEQNGGLAGVGRDCPPWGVFIEGCCNEPQVFDETLML